MFEDAYRLLYPRQTVLVTSCSRDGKKKNVLTLDWTMPTSFSPPMVAISIGKSRYSHELIKEGREFVVALPTEKMENIVLYCGGTTGRNRNKFKESGLTPVDAEKVKAPLIKECPVNVECRVVETLDTGDHTVFVGEVVAVHESGKGNALINAGGRKFTGMERKG